jgi:hypothetical protein
MPGDHIGVSAQGNDMLTTKLNPAIGDSGPRAFDFLLDDNAVIQKSSFSAQGQGSFRAYFCMDDSQPAAYNFTWGPLAPTNGTEPDPTSAR